MSCSRTSNSNKNLSWSSENYKSDSLMREFDFEMQGDPELKNLEAINHQLEELGRVEKDSATMARLYYNKAVIARNQGNKKEGFSLLERSRELVDSNSHPYDYARFEQYYLNDHYFDDVDKIKLLMKNIKIYKSVNDSIRISEAYNQLAIIFKKSLDFDTASDLYTEARRYLSDNMVFAIFVNDYNRALLYDRNKAKKDSAAIIFKRLLEYPRRKEYERINRSLLEKNYLYTGDVRYLKESITDYENNDSDRYLPYAIARTSSMLADYFIGRGERDSASYYADMTWKSITQNYNTGLSVEGIDILDNLLNVYKEIGNKDLENIVQFKIDSLNQISNVKTESAEIQKLKNADVLESIYLTIEEEKNENSTLNWTIVALIIIVLLLIQIFAFKLYKKRNSEEKKVINQTVDTQNRELTVIRMKLAETDGDWTQFSLLFGRLNPNFIDSLLALHPNLTKGDIRLACMTMLGAETKEIASAMKIMPESVRKNRQRLRAKLGIDAEQTLNDYLRSVASKARKIKS